MASIRQEYGDKSASNFLKKRPGSHRGLDLQWLDAWLTENNWTRANFAEHLEINERTLRSWISGESGPRDTIQDLLKQCINKIAERVTPEAVQDFERRLRDSRRLAFQNEANKPDRSTPDQQDSIEQDLQLAADLLTDIRQLLNVDGLQDLFTRWQKLNRYCGPWRYRANLHLVNTCDEYLTRLSKFRDPLDRMVQLIQARDEQPSATDTDEIQRLYELVKARQAKELAFESLVDRLATSEKQEANILGVKLRLEWIEALPAFKNWACFSSWEMTVAADLKEAVESLNCDSISDPEIEDHDCVSTDELTSLGEKKVQFEAYIAGLEGGFCGEKTSELEYHVNVRRESAVSALADLPSDFLLEIGLLLTKEEFYELVCCTHERLSGESDR